MATVTAPLTPAEFDLLEDREGRKFELLDGELIEMPSASGPHNYLAGKLIRRLGTWTEDHGTAVVIGETEFRIGDSRLRPDVAVLSLAKWDRIGEGKAPLPEPPDIAVEIVSPSESAVTLDLKIASYLAAGVLEVWELYHSSEHLFIHKAEGVLRLDRNSTIETPLIPGWSLAMSDLLRKKGHQYF